MGYDKKGLYRFVKKRELKVRQYNLVHKWCKI